MTKATLVSGVVAVYGYDGDGRRVKKSVTQGSTTTVTRFVYGPGGSLVAEYEGATVNPATPMREYVYGPTGLLAIVEGGGIKYLTPDHLGTPRVVTDGTGTVVSRRDFFPFGEEIGAGIGGRTDGMGFSVDDKVRQKFTGYERDNETGLDFAQARYYGSGMGRFLSADPLLHEAKRLIDPQQLNLYVYVRNNPLNFIDPSGKTITGSSGGEPGNALTEEDRKRLEQELQTLAPGTKVDFNGNIHKPGFFRRILNQFTGHGEGTNLISRLADSNLNVNIVLNGGILADVMNNINSERAAKTNEQNGGIDVVVRFDPDTNITLEEGSGAWNDPINSIQAPPAIILGHELIHALHRVNGTPDDDVGPAAHFFAGNGAGYIEYARSGEFRAIGFTGYIRRGDITENQLRRELHLQPRVSYWDVKNTTQVTP